MLHSVYLRPFQASTASCEAAVFEVPARDSLQYRLYFAKRRYTARILHCTVTRSSLLPFLSALLFSVSFNLSTAALDVAIASFMLEASL